MPNRPQDLALKGGGCLYSSIAASAALTNSTTETTLDSVSVAADVLKAGDVLEIFAGGIATATNLTDTLTVKIKIGTSILLASEVVDVADNDIWVLHAHVTIRTDGSSGTLVAHGHTNLGVNGTATTRADALASATVDTTAAQTVACTGTWSVASASNSCRNDQFVVKLHRPATFN